jgi:uncharacterized membrane protein YeaQ/YmgE (transglycosylase-associated protein family)
MLTVVVEWLVVGLIAGFNASRPVNRSGAGLGANVVLGVIGALVGGFISTLILHGPPVRGLDISSLAIAAVGAVIVLLGYHMLMRRRRLTVGGFFRRALRR